MLDGWQRWDKAVNRRWSKRIATAMIAHGIQAVQCDDEICVYDVSQIVIVDDKFASWPDPYEFEAG